MQLKERHASGAPYRALAARLESARRIEAEIEAARLGSELDMGDAQAADDPTYRWSLVPAP